MLPIEVSTKIKPTDAKTICGIATTHFQDGKKPLNHRISRNEDPTWGCLGTSPPNGTFFGAPQEKLVGTFPKQGFI